MRLPRFVALVAALVAPSLFAQALRPAVAPTTTSAPATVAPLDAPAAPAAASEFACFGVAMDNPPGWRRVLEGSTGMIARWAHTAANGEPDAMLAIELQPAGTKTLDQFATDVAKQTGGHPEAAPASATIGGEKVMRVTGGNRSGLAAEALMAQHGNFFYVISGFADAPQQLPRQAIEALGGGLKFVPMAEPLTYTKLRDQKFPVFNKFLIQPLATMRPNPEPPPKGQISVSTFNFTRLRPDVIMTMQVIPNPAHATLAQMQAQFPGKLAAQGPGAPAPPPVTWADLGANPLASICSIFDATNEGRTMKTRAALVQLSPEEVVMLFFNFPNSDPAALAAYERATEEVVKSVQAVPAPAAPAVPAQAPAGAP